MPVMMESDGDGRGIVGVIEMTGRDGSDNGYELMVIVGGLQA